MSRLAMRRPRTLIILTGILALSAAIVGAQVPKPRPVDEYTAKLVSNLLERGHLAKPTINDEISKKWFKNFLTSLDPRKYNFLKADVDAFKAREEALDDHIKDGDVTFAQDVYKVYLERSKQRLDAALEILKQKPDFTVDESLADDLDKLDYPADEKEANDRLRKWIKFDLLRDRLAKLDEAKSVEQLTIRFKDAERAARQVDQTDLLEIYLSALTNAIDPHSSYMGPKTWEDMINQTLHLSLEGIGASLQSINGYPTVMEVVPGMAADKDGRLQIEDKIVGIENTDGTKDDFVLKKLSDVVRKIRGPAGTKVRLIVDPADGKEQRIYELTRAKVELTESHAKGQVIDIKSADNKPIKVGIVHLPNFYGDSSAVQANEPDAVSMTRDVRKILDGFKKDKVASVVVDLRHNGGGLLSEAISLSGLFIDEGPVVQVRETRGKRHYDDDDAGVAWDGPLVVLIDHASASASEIFAGVIKDYGRGLIVGDSTTFGKGTVQQVIPLDEHFHESVVKLFGDPDTKLGALKLTVSQFYRPNGDSTQIKGVPSDIHIPSVRDQQDYNEGKSDTALKFDSLPALPHDQYNRVPAALVSKLNERSEERRKASPKFQKLDAQIKKVADRKAKHEISLKEATYKEQDLIDDADDEFKPSKARADKARRSRSRTVWETELDFVNDEISNVVADYLSLGSDVLLAAPVRQAERKPEPPALMP